MNFSIVSTYLKPEDKEALTRLAKREGVSLSKLLYPVVMGYLASSREAELSGK